MIPLAISAPLPPNRRIAAVRLSCAPSTSAWYRASVGVRVRSSAASRSDRALRYSISPTAPATMPPSTSPSPSLSWYQRRGGGGATAVGAVRLAANGSAERRATGTAGGAGLAGGGPSVASGAGGAGGGALAGRGGALAGGGAVAGSHAAIA